MRLRPGLSSPQGRRRVRAPSGGPLPAEASLRPPGARPARMGVGSAPHRAKESRVGSQHRCRLKHITVLGNRGIKKSRFFSLPQSRPAVKAFCKCSPSSPTDARCVVACGFLIAEAPSSLASLSSVCRLPLGSRSICSHDKTSSGLLGAEMRREPGLLAGPGRPVSRPGLVGRGAELYHENEPQTASAFPCRETPRSGSSSRRRCAGAPGAHPGGVLCRTSLPEARSADTQSWPCPALPAQDWLLNTCRPNRTHSNF